MLGASLVGLLLAACSEKGTVHPSDDTADQQDDTATELTWFRDADSDGFGDPATTFVAESAPSGFVADGTDCDDGDASVFPGALETCNGVDDDCDRQVDEGLEFATWYLDGDKDGFGLDGDTIDSCAEPEGYAAVGGDCDDDDPAIHPGAEEVCENGTDEDCDGEDPRCRLEGEISLSDATVKYLGGTAGDLAGYQLACGGDTDGDGWPELLIGESEQFTEEYGGGAQIGGVWLVTTVAPGSHLLDTSAVALWGDAASTFFDGAKSFLPDLDGDGFDEVLMGSTGADEVYLFAGPITSPRLPTEADAIITQTGGGLSLGWRATALDAGAFAVSGVSNLYQDGQWGRAVGGVFVFEGPQSGDVTTDDAVASIEPSVYHQYGYFGSSMCSGDLDGDGVADLVIGAPSGYPTAYPDFMARGVVYVVHGPIVGDLRMAEEEGALVDADARIESSGDLYSIGYALSCGGDADGDGLADILVGAPDLSGGGYAGARGNALLFLDTLHGVVDAEDADGRVNGTLDEEYLGTSVSLDADLDGDGRQDPAIGSYAASWRGEVSVFYGGYAGVVGRHDAGASIQGEAEDDYAMTVSGCPDLDGDGIDDLVVGAAGESTNGTWSGAAYLLFGGSGEGP